MYVLAPRVNQNCLPPFWTGQKRVRDSQPNKAIKTGLIHCDPQQFYFLGLSTILSLQIYCFHLRLSLYQCCKQLHRYPAKVSQGVTVHLRGLGFEKGFRGVLQAKHSHLLTSFRNPSRNYSVAIWLSNILIRHTAVFVTQKKPVHL